LPFGLDHSAKRCIKVAHRDLITLGARMPAAKRLHLVRDLRVEEDRDGVSLRRLPEWLAELEV